MNILTVSKLKKEFAGERLFEGVSFDINDKDKIAIIGKNGTGKSTLLHMIRGDLPIDGGELHINNKATIGYLSQDVITDQGRTLFATMLDVFADLIDLERHLASLADDLAADPHDDDLMRRYAEAEHRFDIRGGYTYPTEIRMILDKFGFVESDHDRMVNTFSGGEKTRIAFAKLLLMKPDLLMLDEPTNHLDIEIIDWLEDYLTKYDGAVLMVTHDKYFISKVCRKIIELDHATSHVYHGTFDMYEEEKIKRYELLLKRYNRQQKEIAHLQSFIDRFRYNAKRASLAKDRAKKIERIDKIDKPTLSKKRVVLDFKSKRPTREIILEAKNLAIGYGKTPLLSDINFTMRGFDKLAIIGPNGTGKTTLLKVLERKLPALSGKIEFLREYRIGYFDQNQETLHFDKTIYQEIHDLHPLFTNYDVRSVAARFLFFGDDLDKPIHILSGGEKVRLVLLLLMLEQPDLLVLDEPTNHLDIETKDIVEDVLDQFSGPVIFVSHDRYFINKLATKIVHLSDDRATIFDGDYDAFKEQQKKSSPTTKANDRTIPAPDPVQPDLERQARDLERDIHQLEQQIATLRKQSFEEDVYQDYHQITAINRNIEALEQSIQERERAYYDLLAKIEGKEV